MRTWKIIALGAVLTAGLIATIAHQSFDGFAGGGVADHAKPLFNKFTESCRLLIQSLPADRATARRDSVRESDVLYRAPAREKNRWR